MSLLQNELEAMLDNAELSLGGVGMVRKISFK